MSHVAYRDTQYDKKKFKIKKQTKNNVLLFWKTLVKSLFTIP